MTIIEASTYMTQHMGQKPMTGYFVQRRRAGSLVWENMACTWPTREEAERHRQDVGDDLGGQTRLCECVHTPQA